MPHMQAESAKQTGTVSLCCYDQHTQRHTYGSAARTAHVGLRRKMDFAQAEANTSG